MQLKTTTKPMFMVLTLALLTNTAYASDHSLLRRGSSDDDNDDRKPETHLSSDHKPNSSIPVSNTSPSAPSQTNSASSFNGKVEIGNDRTGPKLKIERKQKSKRGILTEDSFLANLKLPVPSTNLGIGNAGDASVADVILSLSRQNVKYAICTLDFDQIKNTRFGLRAEYKVKMEIKLKKSSNLRLKKGVCDIDLAVAGDQSAIPNIMKNDSYLVEVNEMPMYSGNF